MQIKVDGIDRKQMMVKEIQAEPTCTVLTNLIKARVRKVVTGDFQPAALEYKCR